MRNWQKFTAALVIAAFGAISLAAPTARAHHGWRWAESDNSEITGTLKSVKLGNPHGEVTLDVDGEEWTAEIGQPWRNDRAGLTDDILKAGITMTIRGHRAADANKKLIKAERVVIDGKSYDLYPGRD
jgi:hypothetical protein